MSENSKTECSAEALLADWIAYAERLERVLEIVAESSVDQLKALQAKNALQRPRPHLRVV